ncbi:GGDEF domain-containing protein [Marinobacter sp. 1Y8]
MPNVAETFLFSRFARLSIIGLILVAAFTAWQGAYFATAASLLASAIITCRFRAEISKQRKTLIIAARVCHIALLVVLAPAILTNASGLTQWSYVFPLATFAIWPVRWACAVIVPYLALVALAGTDVALGPDRHQFVACVLLAVLLSALFVFLREYKTRQLAPLRRTDELTQAASRDYLSADLHQEIQRSEREGLALAVILIGLDIHKNESLPDADLNAILPRIGRYLNSQLRDFDSYYRVADMQFLAILPGTQTTEAATKADILRKGLHQLLESHGLSITISAGVGGLNIGDDAESLQQSVERALLRAQQEGGDRTQTYSVWSGPQRTTRAAGAAHD